MPHGWWAAACGKPAELALHRTQGAVFQLLGSRWCRSVRGAMWGSRAGQHRRAFGAVQVLHVGALGSRPTPSGENPNNAGCGTIHIKGDRGEDSELEVALWSLCR